MKKQIVWASGLIIGIFFFNQAYTQPIIANYQSTHLNEVPEAWISQAKLDFRIWYGHTSHGSQITTGIANLQSNIGTPYTYNSSGSGGALSYQETGGDLGHNGDLNWYHRTKEKLDEAGNDRNVVIWSWCGGVSDNTPTGISIYLDSMNLLEQDYPNVLFVYMTGHLDIWSWANLKAGNQQIRNYCIANNKILFDFADIESYDPDLTYFEYATDNCNYYDGPGGNYQGNWANEWCTANPGSDLCWSCSCAHSQPLNCNLKGRAFWWMLAEMAGWKQSIFISEVSDPLDNSNARYVELYNSGTDTIDFSTVDWYLAVQNNGSTWHDIQLSGLIAPDEKYVISYGSDSSNFYSTYGFNPDVSSTHISDGGGDGYFLYRAGDHFSGILMDAYGVIDTDGTGTNWEYKDTKVVRKYNITTPGTIWTFDEWIIRPQANVADMTPDFHRENIVWQGNASTDWNSAGQNWNSPHNFVPDETANVTVPNVTNQPVIVGDAHCNDLTVEPDATLTVTGNLTVRGVSN